MSLEYQDSGFYDPYAGSYDSYPSYMTDSYSSGDFGAGWAKTIQDSLLLAGKTAAQIAVMKQAQQGQTYLEGQRLASMQYATGGIPLLWLLVGLGALVFVMKD